MAGSLCFIVTGVVLVLGSFLGSLFGGLALFLSLFFGSLAFLFCTLFGSSNFLSSLFLSGCEYDASRNLASSTGRAGVEACCSRLFRRAEEITIQVNSAASTAVNRNFFISGEPYSRVISKR